MVSRTLVEDQLVVRVQPPCSFGTFAAITGAWAALSQTAVRSEFQGSASTGRGEFVTRWSKHHFRIAVFLMGMYPALCQHGLFNLVTHRISTAFIFRRRSSGLPGRRSFARPAAR